MEKLDSLRKEIAKRGNLLVAFSGGVDSTFLAKVAHDVLGGKALALTIDSGTLPRSELEEAKRLAGRIGIKHRIAKVPLNPQTIKNPKDRCYHCKKEVVNIFKDIAREEGLDTIAEGATFSDLGDHRPGIRAGEEGGIWHPLVEFKFTKDEIRSYARKMGLPNWNKPSMACLASRVPYGSEITAERLKRIEEGEDFLKSEGLRQVRVRDHEGLARIEVDDLDKFLKLDFKEINEKLRSLGFCYVTLDLGGYRAGGVNG